MSELKLRPRCYITEMKLKRGASAIPAGQPKPVVWLLLLCLVFAVVGCGVPGEPVPPSPPIPLPVTDLTAVQRGDGVLLSFTLPKKDTRSQRLTQTPTADILRGSLRPDGLPDLHSLHVVDTIPSAVLNSYIQDGKVEFLEHFSPEETRAHPGEIVVFAVRTRVSERKSSADSNVVVVSLYRVPERIENVQTHESENTIELSWTAPTRTSGGEPLSGPLPYHVYRGEIDPASQTAAEKDLHAAVWKSPLIQIATTTEPQYKDTGFDYGKTYVYVIRNAMQVNGKPLESDDSKPVIITPKDVFPPAAPQDLVAAVLAGAQAGSYVVDLSWGINVETDLAGYRVYRSERENQRGELLTPHLLPSSEYRDTQVVSGQRYWYTVTAVDKAGNESAPSAPLSVEIP
jgi:hypothetical protein